MSLERIADMRRAAGDIEGARAAIVEALALSRAQGRKQMVASGLALLSALCGGRRETLHGAVSDDPAARPGDDPQAGLAASGDVVQAAALALAEVGDTSDHGHAHFLLWLATRDRVHLAEAKRRLDVVVDQAPPACREAMLTNLRQHREIMAAAKAEGL
jgi:hypothetical protein